MERSVSLGRATEGRLPLARGLRPGARWLRGGAVPPQVSVLLAVASVQVGAALAKTVFGAVGPVGAVFLRAAVAAVVLLAVWRPRLRGHARGDLLTAVAFGLALAGMNLCFYLALDRIPLGVAVTLEFTGPLGLAILASRRPLDFLWGLLAGAGIVLLGPFDGAIDARGAVLALLAGLLWAAYILLGARTGRAFSGGTGLALALGVGALALAPVGVARAGAVLHDPWLLAAGVGVGLLSSVIPYTLELEALRRLPARVFGVLMSLEPAVAALVGLIFLGEGLAPRTVVAIGLVVAASVGATRAAGRDGGFGGGIA